MQPAPEARAETFWGKTPDLVNRIFFLRPALAWKRPGAEGVTMIETTGGLE